MELWEKRYLHDKDVMEIQCLSTGREIPPDPGYGRVSKPKLLWTKFCGPKFWPLMSERGHTSLDFDKCACKKEK